MIAIIIISEMESHTVAQAGPKLVILLPQPSKCCDYRAEPLLLASYCCAHTLQAFSRNLEAKLGVYVCGGGS